MKLKMAERWVDGRLKARLPTGWIDPERLLVKQAGIWERLGFQGRRLITDLPSILETPGGWVFHETLGWRKDTYSGWARSWTTLLDPEELRDVRSVEMTFSSYYNTPAYCMGATGIDLRLDDGTTKSMGISDSWDEPSSGMTYNAGELGGGMTYGNLFNLLGRLTIPEGRYLTHIGLRSTGYNDNGTAYPITLRGMKDLVLDYGS